MNRFDELDLPEYLNQALEKIGFVEPTEIQQKALPILFAGNDLMACSQTGSGKTAAYLIPMLKDLMENPESQGLVMAPTRELAQQISDFLVTLVPARAFHTTKLVGGQDIRKQFKSLQKKPRVIVATPGRLIDHLKRNTIQIHKVNRLVLDEGDRMIDMGFAPQLQQILKHLPEERQTSFFTATLDEKVQKLAKQYLKSPKKLMINNSLPVSKIKQTVIQVDFSDKDECILNELVERSGSVIIFLKTKHRVDRLTQYLDDYGVPVGKLHGGLTQGQRNKAIASFKNGKIRVLCATDVAARGLDVPHVEHVINCDLPMQDEDYVHRIGRTARNGAEGEAISLVTPNEAHDWNRLVKKYDIPDSLLEVTKKQRKTSNAGRGSDRRAGRRPEKRFSGKSGGGRSRSNRDSDEYSPRSKKSSGSRTRITRSSDESSPRFKKKTSSLRDRSSRDSEEFSPRSRKPASSRSARSSGDHPPKRKTSNKRTRPSGNADELFSSKDAPSKRSRTVKASDKDSGKRGKFKGQSQRNKKSAAKRNSKSRSFRTSARG